MGKCAACFSLFYIFLLSFVKTWCFGGDQDICCFQVCLLLFRVLLAYHVGMILCVFESGMGFIKGKTAHHWFGARKNVFQSNVGNICACQANYEENSRC